MAQINSVTKILLINLSILAQIKNENKIFTIKFSMANTMINVHIDRT